MPTALISGASIAGPALAWWLARAGYAVTLVERAPAPRPGGQAIDVRGPALAVLDAMGIGERARAMRTRLRGLSVVDRDGREIERSTERTATGGRFDSGDVEILRDDLAALLLDAPGAVAARRHGDTIARLDAEPDGVTATFADGDAARFDLVFGADGLGSGVRRLAFGPDDAFVRPLGVVLAVFTAPNILGLHDWQIAFRDETTGYAVYPARGNTELRVNLGFGLAPEEATHGDAAARKRLIVARMSHLGGVVPRLLEALASADDLYFGPAAQVRMDAWSRGRVALVGDAACCPSPFSGQGTSLALVGAFVLGREIARSPDEPVAAFARAEARLRPFVRANQDLVDMTRAGPPPDAVFTAAKNGIALDDLLAS